MASHWEMSKAFGVSAYWLYLWSVNEETQVWKDLNELYELTQALFKPGFSSLWYNEANVHFNWQRPANMIIAGSTQPLLNHLRHWLTGGRDGVETRAVTCRVDAPRTSVTQL